MSRFQSLDMALAQDKNFREFFSALASGASHPSSLSTDASERLEADVTGRQYNNLLRRLDPADFALIEPHLVPVQTLESRRCTDRTAFPLGAGAVAPTTISEDFDTAKTVQNSHTPNVGATTN